MSGGAVAIFDIDGTLLRSARLDEECWCESVALTFGIHGVSTDWGSYAHSTDRAILDEVLRTRRGTPMTDADEAEMVDSFLSLLRRRIADDPDGVAATFGAAEALAKLPHHGWRVAIGTGGWRRSALLKLDAAGLDVTDVPAAFAEDGPERERIISTAIERAADGDSAFERIVYLGDGRWDAKAARNVNAGFVGVGVGDTADALRGAGAAEVLPDFGDLDALLRALERARVPLLRG